LKGAKLEMKKKERTVFENMAKAFKVYDQLIENMQVEHIVKIDELIKLIRNNLQKDPEKAKK